MFAKILKANPYHDEQGLFTSKDKASTVSAGDLESWHGTHAADKLIEEGYVVGAAGSPAGKGAAVLGAGMYLADNQETAKVYGSTLKVKLEKVRLKRVTLSDITTLTSSKEFKKKLSDAEDAWDGNFWEAPDFKTKLISEHYKAKGFDGLECDMPGSGKVEASTVKVIFDPASKIKSMEKVSKGKGNTMKAAQAAALPTEEKVAKKAEGFLQLLKGEDHEV